MVSRNWTRISVTYKFLVINEYEQFRLTEIEFENEKSNFGRKTGHFINFQFFILIVLVLLDRHNPGPGPGYSPSPDFSTALFGLVVHLVRWRTGGQWPILVHGNLTTFEALNQFLNFILWCLKNVSIFYLFKLSKYFPKSKNCFTKIWIFSHFFTIFRPNYLLVNYITFNR